MMRLYIITHTKLGRILRNAGCEDSKAHIRALKETPYTKALTPKLALDCAGHNGKE